MMNQLDNKVDGALQQPNRFRNSRLVRRFHPLMIEEILHMSAETGDPSSILMAASFVRDDAPWLYELAMEVYRAVKSENMTAINREMKRLERFSDYMIHSSVSDAMGLDSKDAILCQEFPRILERLLDRILSEKKPNSRRGLLNEPISIRRPTK